MSEDLVDLHLAHLSAGGRSQTTIDSRKAILRRLSNRLDYGLVYAAAEHIEAWLAELRRLGRSRCTIKIYHYHVHAFFAWAVTTGILEWDPTEDIPSPKAPTKLPNPVTEEELARALSLAEPLRTAIVLAAFEGLRRSEIAACRREHITEEMTRIPTGKGGEEGAVPTHPYVWAHVRDRPPGLLVTNRQGGPVNGHWLSKYARYAFDAVGMPEVHLHRLRDRYGTLIQELYGDIRVTQECLRHKRITTTEGYTMVTGKRRAAAVTALPVPTLNPQEHPPV